MEIDGVSLADDPKRAKTHLGYLPEVPPLYGELTVDEYLAFCARLHHVPKAEQANAVARAKQACGLTDMASRLISNLSKGYQQRVGIAQAIVHAPEVVILDEPTVGLDPIQIREIRKLIRELGDRHSVILSSHILPEVQSVCDRVMIIHHGQVVYTGTVEDATRAQSEAAIVGFAAPPTVQALQAVPGIAGVEALDATHFSVRYAKGVDPRVALAQAAAAHGWQLNELRPVTKTLEERFVELTTGEEEHANEQREAA